MNYDDENRGKIQLNDRFKQPIVFDGMRYGNITPTDIDALIEFHDEFCIIIEAKHRSVIEIPKGQAACLLRLADAYVDSGRDSLLIVCVHDVDDPSEPVILKDAFVRRVRWKKKWFYIAYPRRFTVGDICTQSMEWAEEKERQR